MVGRRASFATVLLVAILLLGQLQLPTGARAASLAAQECFAVTNLCVDDPFLSYWREHGGLAINGYPITAAFEQRLENGTIYTVQYFERVRLEAHPAEYGAPAQVLLGQFGRILYPTDPAMPLAGSATPRAGATYFAETGHNLAGRFLSYWQANGGLAQFGYPLSEEFTERLEDGKAYTVQYFERARFEYHPENAAPYDVLLGQFGRRIVAARDGNPPLPVGLPPTYLSSLYPLDLSIRARLGGFTGPVSGEGVTVLPFERGAMLYRANTRTITVFATDPNVSSPVGSYRLFADTWAPGQEPGGGMVAPGLFNPRQGFGKVWRENADVRQQLGFAVSDTELGREPTIITFNYGTILDIHNSPTGDYRTGRGVFAFYGNGRFEYRAPCTFLDC